MKKTAILFNKLKRQKLTALLSPGREAECLTAYETFAPLDIPLEIALRTPAAIGGIRAVMSEHPDALILAGTVMTAKQAELAIQAGVAGIISADYVEDVVRVCVDHDLMCIPGGIGDVGKQLTLKAKLYGCELDELAPRYPYQWIHKLFPAITSSVSFLGLGPAWKGPYKQLQVMYTGGVLLQNLPQVVANDADGIICGSALTRDIGHPEKMSSEAAMWLKLIHANE